MLPGSFKNVNSKFDKMATAEIIKEFFEEQFRNTSQFFLYKDKQLLKKASTVHTLRNKSVRPVKSSGLLRPVYFFALGMGS